MEIPSIPFMFSYMTTKPSMELANREDVLTKQGECSLVGVVEPTTAIVSAPQRAFIASCCPRGGKGQGEKREWRERRGQGMEREREKEGGRGR